MVFSRQYDGFLIGNLTINGVGNHWMLLAIKPQFGFFTFTGQEITSNLLEYPDADGQGVILAGDAFNGRVKRLLDPATLVEVLAASDTTAGYSCEIRQGWRGAEDGQQWSLDMIRFPATIVPGTAITLSLTGWRGLYPVRDEADLESDGSFIENVTLNDLYLDIPLPPSTARFHSMAVGWNSVSGADGLKPAEVPRFLMFFDREASR